MGAIIKDLKLTEAGGSATEPVTVQEVKTYLQTEGTAYDGPIALFITAARQLIERMCGVSLIEKTAIATIHTTGYKEFYLPYEPVTAVSQVRWKKCPSQWVTLVGTDEEDYELIGQNKIAIKSSEVGLHEVTYTLGVDDRDIFRQAVKAQAAFMFNSRDGNAGGGYIDRIATIAPEVKGLLMNYIEIA